MPNESIKKIALDALRGAVSSTANEVADFLDTILDQPAKDGLIQVLDDVKKRINRTHKNEDPEEKKE